MKRTRTNLLGIVVLLLFAPCGHALAPAQTEMPAVKAALTSFIEAFDNLDWDKFRCSFEDDATVFYPRAFPHRASGREEFEKTFRTVFEQIRGSQTHPPYMHINPIDLQIQLLGDIAIATFHLDDRPGMLNRRTLVLHKTESGWKIVHLHASEVAVGPPAK